MKFKKLLHNEIISELNEFTKEQQNRFPSDEILTIDLHCHDYNSNEPDEIIGRLLTLPESWQESESLINTLRQNGCNALTITNHNNARSCYEMQDRGEDILTGAEFACTVPDFSVGIHVLAYGFTPEQESKLNKYRSSIYKFQEYTYENDIPTIWAHPLYHYKYKDALPLDFFDKMLLLFERYEVLNGQRDTWQNMLVKNWIQGITPQTIDDIAKKTGIKPDTYCRNPYLKSMAGGSDSHMGIFAGLTGTRVHVQGLKVKKETMKNSEMVLEAIKAGNLAPFGTNNSSEKMTVTFLDYFCQVPMHLEDPGLLRLILHKGSPLQKFLAFIVGNGFAELTRHKVTAKFLKVFHECFTGNVPGLKDRIIVPKNYRPIFSEAIKMAETRKNNPPESVRIFDESIYNIFNHLTELLVQRLTAKFKKVGTIDEFKSLRLEGLIRYFEVPSFMRMYTKTNKKKTGNILDFNKFMDGLPFPALASIVIYSASFVSSKVLYNSRGLLKNFAKKLGKLEHPERTLWFTDTFEDTNGVALVLKSMLAEIQKKDLPIDIIVCSSTLKPEDHLIVVPPVAEFTLPFYQQQPVRIPNILEVHRLFKDGEYDKIITSTEGVMGMISILLKNAYSVPAYFYVHTDWMTFIKTNFNVDQHDLNRIRRILRAFYKNFDKLFVLNSDQEKWFQSSAMGFDKSDVFLTAHWAKNYFKPVDIEKNIAFGTTNGDPVILFAGRLSEEKGVMELPAIYTKIKQAHPEAKIALAGRGPAEESLKEAMPDAIFMGWVDHSKLPEVYSAADIMILPSKFDTFGCVILEALSCGLPVAAYNTKGPKDIIEDGVNGFLARSKTQLADFIISYLDDSKAKKNFRKKAIKRAENYNADLIMNRFLHDAGIELN
ncbi:MAG: glycosyltransferase [Spirochaetes bacterium]|nr:glycosyltransferase [Spirochaetota bacterium]